MVEKLGGWTGKILRINLTRQRTETIPTQSFSERFIGGLGIAAKIAWDEITPDIHAFDSRNKLIFSTGPLTGTLAPGSGRMEIMGKSPRTFPREVVTRSGMGGHWGVGLKHAGYDAVILDGEAEKPLYVLINRKEVEFFEAGDLWGQDTFFTQRKIKEKHGPRTDVICIGPAGENKSRIAAIISETGFASGKSGFGGVMGAKRVKAMAVQGEGGSIAVAHPGRLISLASTYRSLLDNNPMREWTIGTPPTDHHLAFFRKHRTGNASCFGCPLQCFAFFRVPGTDPGQAHCVSYYYMKAAYSYYGESIAADQALWEAVSGCNKMGLCSFEMIGISLLLKDLFVAGLVSEQDVGVPLSRYGSKEFIMELIETIAFRKNMGEILAEGAARAASLLPKAWSHYEKYYPAHGQSEHDSVRDFPGIALLWALDSRDPMIDHHAYRHLSVSRQQWPEPHALRPEKAREISKTVFGSEMAVDHRTYEEKPGAIAWCQNRSCVINSLVLCDWLFPILMSQAKEDRMGDAAAESKLLSAVTGIEFSEQDLSHVGERIWNLQRAIMVREGRTRKDDMLSSSYFQKGEINREDFERAKENYYRIRGWNEETGIPTRETLVRLGLNDIAEELNIE